MKRFLLFSLLLILNSCKPTIENEAIVETKIEQTKEVEAIKKNPNDKEHKTKTETFIDSIQKITLNTSSHSFIKMIPNAPHLIWHFNSRNILEIINTNYPDSIILVELPIALRGRVFSKNEILIDHYTNKDIYFCNKGLYYFNIDSNKFLKTPIENCGSLKILKNHIVSKGWRKELVILNKSTNELDTIVGFKEEELNHITITDRFGLIINNHKYNLETKKLDPLKEMDGVALKNGINSLLVQDSFICYSPGRTINVAHTIVNGKHYPKHFISYSNNRVIENEALWTLNGNKISKWDLLTEEISNFKIDFSGGRYKEALNDDKKYWFISNSIYSFNRKEEKYYRHEVFNNNVLQVFLDANKIFILSNNVLTIYNKAYLEQKKSHYDIGDFITQKKSYLAFIDSLGLKKERTYQRYKNKVDLIESKFKDYLAIETNHKHLDVSSTLWSTDSFRESVYAKILTGTLDSIFIEKNYHILIRSLFTKGELRRAFQLDSWTQANYKELRDSLFNNYRYKSSIEGLIKHRVIVDSLDKLTRMRPDSLFFQKTLALELVCTSSWFCHEGCGGCDLSLLTDGLNNFIRKYPTSALISEAEYKLIDLDTYYDTGEDETYYGLEQAYLNFLGKYPKNSKAKEVIKNLLNIYDNRARTAKRNTIYLLQQVEEEYEYLNEDKDIQRYRERITNSNR